MDREKGPESDGLWREIPGPRDDEWLLSELVVVHLHSQMAPDEEMRDKKQCVIFSSEKKKKRDKK